MIRKPAEDWGRENAAVETVRNVAAGGKAAVETGGRIVRGGYLCAIGGVFLFAALTAGLLGGSIPTLIGAGVIGSLLVGAGLRAFKPASVSASVETTSATAMGFATGTSSAVDYSRGKLLTQAGLGAIFLAIAASGFGHTGGVLHVVLLLLIPAAGFMIFGSVRKAFGDLAALRWDGQSVTVARLFKNHTVPWSSVRSISLDQINTYAYGFVKVGSRRLISIRLDGGMFAKRLSVSASLLDLNGRTLEGVVLALQAAQLGRPSTSPELAPRRQSEAPQQPPRQAPASATHTAATVAPYGGQRPAAYGAAPAQPTFGRRGL